MQFLFKKRKAPEKDLGINLITLVETTLISAILFASRVVVSIYYTFAPTRFYLKRLFATNFQIFLSPISLLAITYIAYYSVVEYFLFLREFYDAGRQGVDRVSSIIETGFSIENFVYPLLVLALALAILYGLSLVLIHHSDAWRRYFVYSAASSSSASLLLFIIFISYASLPVETVAGQNSLNIYAVVLFWIASACFICAFVLFQMHFRAYITSRAFMRTANSWQLSYFTALNLLFLLGILAFSGGEFFTPLLFFMYTVNSNWVGVIFPFTSSEQLTSIISSILNFVFLAVPIYFAMIRNYDGGNWKAVLSQIYFLVTASFYVFAVSVFLAIAPVAIYDNPLRLRYIFPRVEGPPNFHCSAFISDQKKVHFYLTNRDSNTVIIWPRSLEMRQSSSGGMRRSPDKLLIDQIEHTDFSMPILLKPGETLVLVYSSTSRDKIAVTFETDYQTNSRTSRLSVCSSLVYRRPFG